MTNFDAIEAYKTLEILKEMIEDHDNRGYRVKTLSGYARRLTELRVAMLFLDT